MKKIISLAMAAVMTAGMAVTAFARPSDPEKEPFLNNESPAYVFDDSVGALVEASMYATRKGTSDVKQEYGTRFAYEIQYNEDLPKAEVSKMLSKYKLTFDIRKGADLVENVAVKYMRVDNGKRFVGSRTPVYKNTTLYDAGKIDLELLPSRLRRAIYKANPKAELHVYYNDMGRLGEKDEKWDETAYDRLVAEFKSADSYQKELRDIKDAVNMPVFAVGIKTSKGAYTLPDIEDYFKETDTPNKIRECENKIIDAALAEVLDDIADVKVTSKESFDEGYFAVVDVFEERLGKNNNDIMGFLTIAKTGTNAKDNIDDEDLRAEVNYRRIMNPDVVNTAGTLEEFEFTELDKDGLPVVKASYEVDTKLVDWFDKTFTMKTDVALMNKYEEGWFQFYQWPAKPDFKEVGRLYFYTENEDAMVFGVNDNGELRSIRSTYDYDRQAVVIETRGLRSYIVTNQNLLAK